MRWRRQGRGTRPPRPKTRRLTPDEQEQLLHKMTKAIERSPVLRAFDVKAELSRGRYYLQWNRTLCEPDEEESVTETRGRITPLEDPKGALMLEVEYRQGRWSEVTQGSVQKVMNAVAGDKKGTFHGLGTLDKSLRKVEKEGKRPRIKKSGRTKFIDADTGKTLSAQEAFYYYFRVPIPVIAEPAVWYSRHRTPQIVQNSRDRTRVLVRFTQTSWSGDTFSGSCLYLKDEGEWGAYTIRPNKSEDIATAERWLIKRNWQPWC